MSKHPKDLSLISEHQALGVYLEALLEEVPDTLPETITEEKPVITAREVLTPPVIASPMPSASVLSSWIDLDIPPFN